MMRRLLRAIKKNDVTLTLTLDCTRGGPRRCVTELEVLLGRGSSRDDDLLVAGNLAHINQPDDNGVTPLHTGCAISRTLTR